MVAKTDRRGRRSLQKTQLFHALFLLLSDFATKNTAKTSGNVARLTMLFAIAKIMKKSTDTFSKILKNGSMTVFIVMNNNLKAIG